MEKDNNALTEKELARLEEIALRRLPIWSWYIRGAREMLLRMREALLTDEPKIKHNKDEKILKKAILDMLMYDKAKIDKFLRNDYDGIRFRNYVRNKKGKLVSCKAFFAKKKITYEEI